MRMGRKVRVAVGRTSRSVVETLEQRQLLATISGSSDTDIYWDTAGQWYSSDITISDAPANAIAIAAAISWNIDANSVSSVSYHLSGPDGYTSSTYSGLTKTGTDILSGFPESNSGTRTIALPAGTAVNGTWSFGVMDSDDWLGMGRIDSWSLTITYTIPPAPEMQVMTSSEVGIPDGDTTPSTAEGTDFGTVTRGGMGSAVRYMIRNTGTSDLILGAITVPDGYTLMEAPPSVIPYGWATFFTVALQTTTAGTFSGDVCLVNNDADENPYNFRITGVVLPANLTPTDITLSANMVAENQPAGAVVGTFSTTDPDVGDSFTYTLLPPDSFNHNDQFQIVGNELRTAATFNREARNSYTVAVRSTDQGGLYVDKSFAIGVLNVNEAPTGVALSCVKVLENQPTGTVVGTFSSTDPDVGSTFTYSLASGAGDTDNAAFAISGNQLVTADIFHLAARSSYSVRVRTTDGGGLYFEKAFTIAVRPRDLYVDVSSPGSTRDGASWTTAYADLQLALADAIAGNRILVADGIYKPTATTDRSISFQLKDGVSLVGGYAGYGSTDPDARDRMLYRTILSGDLGTAGDNTDNTYQVIRGDASITASAVVDGFVITAGYAKGTGSATRGGGIYLYMASPTLANLVFTGNVATYGGAMYNDSYAYPTLTNCTFSGNSAFRAAAIYDYFSSPTLTNCTLAGNAASLGMGVYNDHGSPVLTNSIVWDSGSTPIYDYTSSASVITYSSIQGGHSGTGNLSTDPLFRRNPSPGDDGTWGTSDDDYGDLRLRSSSPAVNAGNSAAPGLSGITTDLAGSPRVLGGTVDMGAYETDLTPPTVSAVSINDGASHRSTVRKLTVTFSKPVTLSADALTLRFSSGAAIPATLTVTASDLQTYSLTFGGTGAVGGSLPDGIYDLIVSAAGVQDLAGNALVADYTQRFHRLFGDVDGNRVVNALDYAKLKATYGRAASDPLFSSAFDYENNGVINALDLAQFRKRYGLIYSY